MYEVNRKRFDKMQDGAEKIKDADLRNSVQLILMAAEDNANDTYPETHYKYWGIATGSIESVDSYQDNDAVIDWFSKFGIG